MLTLPETLTKLGFTIIESNSQPYGRKTTYRHPETLATCCIVGDGNRLKLETLDLSKHSYLTVTLGTAHYQVNHLTVYGGSLLSLDEAITLDTLTLNESSLNGIITTEATTKTHSELHLNQSSVETLTLDTMESCRFSLSHCEVERITLRPAPQDDTYGSVLNTMNLQFCDMRGWSEDEDPALVIASSLRLATVDVLTIASPTPELHLRRTDAAGMTLNLRDYPIPYRLMRSADDTQTYLMLGCWVGTFEEARALIEGEVYAWPSYEGWVWGEPIPSEAQVETARKRYQALLAILESL